MTHPAIRMALIGAALSLTLTLPHRSEAQQPAPEPQPQQAPSEQPAPAPAEPPAPEAAPEAAPPSEVPPETAAQAEDAASPADLVKAPAFTRTDPNEWTMPAKNLAGTRYSELAQINAGNVKDLQVAYSFSLGVNRGQESAVLAVNDTLYMVSPFPNYVFALDMTKPGAPMKWKYNPKAEPAAQGVACCDVVNRGPVHADGKIIFNTLDNFTIGSTPKPARRSGARRWATSASARP